MNDAQMLKALAREFREFKADMEARVSELEKAAAGASAEIKGVTADDPKAASAVISGQKPKGDRPA